MRKWLYLPIETEVREFDAKLLITFEAIKRDYHVVFGNPKMAKQLKYLPRGIFFSKDSDSLAYRLFKDYRKSGGKICVHDEEGFVQFNDEDYIKTRLDFPTLKEVDLYLCWGRHQKKTIDGFKAKYNPRLRTVSTGHPRLDLLRLQERHHERFDRILINTKLSAFNLAGKKEGNNFITLLESHHMLKSEDDYAFYRGYIDYEEKLFIHYQKLIEELSRAFPDKEIMIRPHPGEELSTWQEWAAALPNVVVEKSRSVHHWIKSSDLVIHTGCTTGIESALLGKYTVAFTPIDDPKYAIDLPNQVSHVRVATPRKLIEVLHAFYADFRPVVPLPDNQMLHEYIELGEEPAYRRIVDELDRLSVRGAPQSLSSRLYFTIRRFLNRNRKWTNTKMKHYNTETLRAHIEHLLNAYHIAVPPMKIRELDRNLFLIEKGD